MVDEPMSAEAREIAAALVDVENERLDRLVRWRHKLWAATVVAVAALATVLAGAVFAPERLPWIAGSAGVLGGVAVSVLSGMRTRD